MSAAERSRPDVARQREEWAAMLPGLDPDGLVFLDESGAQTNLARLRGRCPEGERLVASTPHGHWKTYTMLAAVRTTGPCAAALVDGPVDSDVFRAYVAASRAAAERLIEAVVAELTTLKIGRKSNSGDSQDGHGVRFRSSLNVG